MPITLTAQDTVTMPFFGLLPSAPPPPAHITFTRSFAPSEGNVKAPELPYRSEICLNGSWQFQPVAVPESYRPNSGNAPSLTAPTASGWDKTPIKIPSPWNGNAFNQGPGGDFRCYPSYPESWNRAQMGWLQRTVTVPKTWAGRRLLLRFDAIAGNAEVYVNGQKVGENFDLFLPAQYDITNYIRVGQPNEIRVGVRRASLFNKRGVVGSRPYPGGSMWGQEIVGIWQDVFLDAVAPVHVEDDQIAAQVSRGVLADTVTLRNDGRTPQTITVDGEVSPWVNRAGKSVLEAPEPKWALGKPVLSLAPQTVTVPAGQSVQVTLRQPVTGKLRLWSPEAPNLYGMVVSVRQGTQIVDRKYTRFGWREFTTVGNRYQLNGKPIELRGDSWHFLGIPQMTRRYAWAWYRALKDANGNAVRLHAQPYPAFYLDMADEMGVCVLDETAIWGSDAGHAYDNPEFWTRADDHVRRLVLRDRNHASVLGWSVSNELAWYVDGKHPALMDRLKQGWQTWLSTARTLDPTRPWVSTDGDNDASGIMPTSISHYASSKSIVRENKPFGQGETGGAYYATPKQAAPFGGPRAYESQQGRMEAIAREAYQLLKEQRAVNASYVSVFNLVWYGLQPLEFGLPDTSRPYTLSDGVFFPNYREGVPGVQPERLGPYASTLNPGYDPRLPLYRTWPLADAIKAAYASGGPVASPWDKLTPGTRIPVATTPSINEIVLLSSEQSVLANTLKAFGATVVGPEKLPTATFIVIDGAAPARDSAALKAQLSERVRQGATCLVIGPRPETLDTLNLLLPRPIALTNRVASSLLITSPDMLTAGLDNSDFYFTESGSGPIVRHGLTGPLTTGGRVILAASPTDWSRWNNVAEPIKTAATLRSERETKPAGDVLVEVKEGTGRYLVSSIDLGNASTELLETVTGMLARGGVRFGERKTDSNAAIDFVGRLNQALVLGTFEGPVESLYTTDHIGITGKLAPVPGTVTGGKTWKPVSASKNGVFNLRAAGLTGATDNAAAYLSFYVWSPRALDNLLVEPNMPKLDLLMGSDDGCQVWLNGKLVSEDRNVHPVTPDAIVASALPLQRGWNHFIVKVVQGGGEWGYTARFRSTDANFLFNLRSSITPPENKP
ncbi:MAG: glycoside hydrolase family 2 TIM barrel-domain containing protein [Armatimonas sp.]